MLAYTVWHHPQKEKDWETYQTSLLKFHRILDENKPTGYLSSKIIEIQCVPWMDSAERILMDWYFVENSAALDHLNSKVLKGITQEMHDIVARDTSGGVTALYQPKMGFEGIEETNFIYWLDKPKGMNYQNLYQEIGFINDDKQASLWMRYMALGPGPEFCVVTSEKLNFKNKYVVMERELEIVI